MYLIHVEQWYVRTWDRFSALFYEDRECCLHIFPKQHGLFHLCIDFWQHEYSKYVIRNQNTIRKMLLEKNAIRNQKHFKPIANGNVADSGMIALTDESLPCRKPKKEWKFKCKSWIKKTHQLLLLPKYNKTQVNSLLNVSMLFLFLSL